jgi:hypothetical protein
VEERERRAKHIAGLDLEEVAGVELVTLVVTECAEEN